MVALCSSVRVGGGGVASVSSLLNLTDGCGGEPQESVCVQPTRPTDPAQRARPQLEVVVGHSGYSSSLAKSFSVSCPGF